jgi:NarL family two-component system response regulator LiaR
MTQKIRVLIADDHDMVRKGLIVLLENFDEFEVVGEAQDGEDAINKCRRYTPDVVLMDIKMPRMDGISATEKLMEVLPDTKVIMLTSFKQDDDVEGALQAGAISYLMKNVSVNELANAVRMAYNDQPTLAPEAAQVLIQASTRPPQPGHDLTERELEVLALMAEGLNNREIGERLYISGSTVKNHVSSILAKLGTGTRTKAVAIAIEHDILKQAST